MSQQKKGRTAGSIIASILLSILLILPMTLGVVLWEMRSTVSEKGIRYFLDEVDWSRINLSEFDSGKKGSVIDALTEALNNSLKSERFTSADVETLISSPSIKTFLSREIGELAGDLKTGRSTASVTKEEIGQLVEENWDLFEPVFTAEVEPEITKTVDDAAAGKMDPGFRKEFLAFSKNYSTDQKYARMLKEIEETGNIRKEDRDLLYDFVKNEYFVRMFKANLSSFIPDEMTKQLSTAHLRSQLPEDQAGLINTALSNLPFILLLAFCAVFCLLYFLANRRIIGDAFIGLGALLVTILLPLAIAGLRFALRSESWLRSFEGSQLAGYLSGAFTGFHLTGNLICAVIGLGMMVLGIILNAKAAKQTPQSDAAA